MLSILLGGSFTMLCIAAFGGESTADIARAWISGSSVPSMLVFITAAGVLLALTLFTIGALALPVIADRNINVINATHRSVELVKSNTSTILVWMFLLAAFIAAAIISGLILMPVVFPLLAYATWHSYRQLSAKQHEPEDDLLTPLSTTSKYQAGG